jgi:excisionase family DNA binding protein
LGTSGAAVNGAPTGPQGRCRRPKYLTVAQAAEELDVSEDFLERLLTSREIPLRLDGNQLLLLTSWVQQFKRQDILGRRLVAEGVRGPARQQ